MAESEFMFMEGQISGIDISQVKSVTVLSTTNTKSETVLNLRLIMKNGAVKGGKPTSDWNLSSLQALGKRHNVPITVEKQF